MSQTNETKEVSESQKKNWSPQRVAYYASLRSSYHENNKCSTLAMLNLSTAGIGVMITISNFFTFISLYHAVFFALSCLFFLITIILTIHTFNSNTDYINILINDCISEEEDKFKCDMCRMKKSLGRLDKVSGFTFSISIVLAITFSFISIYTKYVQTTGGH